MVQLQVESACAAYQRVFFLFQMHELARLHSYEIFKSSRGIGSSLHHLCIYTCKMRPMYSNADADADDSEYKPNIYMHKIYL